MMKVFMIFISLGKMFSSVELYLRTKRVYSCIHILPVAIVIKNFSVATYITFTFDYVAMMQLLLVNGDIQSLCSNLLLKRKHKMENMNLFQNI